MDDTPIPDSDDHEEASVSLKVVLLLFAVVLIGALAYLVMAERQQSDSLSSAEPAPSVMRKATKTATTTDIANWIVYTNADHGYTIKYPNDWVKNSSLPTVLALHSAETERIIKSGEQALGDFQITYYASLKDLPSYADSSNATTLLGYLKTLVEKNIPASVSYYKASKINDVDGYWFSADGYSSDGGYYLEKNGHIYELLFNTYVEANLSGTQKQIRDSFKFTN